MADEDEIEVTTGEAGEPDEGEREREPQPDPRDAEIERLRQREQQLLEHALATQHQPAPRPEALGPVEPDFSDAEEVGFTPSQAKYLYGKTMAVQVEREERLRRELSAPRPKPIDELVVDFKKKAGRDDLDDDVVEGIAHREARRARAEGVVADHLIEARIVAAIKQRAAAAVPESPERKPGTYVGPAGTYSGVRRAKPAAKDPEVKTLVQVIKEDRRKRGLAYY